MKRQTAKKLYIRDILNSTYIKRPGWDPSGILTNYGEVSRVNVMGIVVSLEEDSLLLDDGTGNVMVRFFDSSPKNIQLGDLANIIGRPREWSSSKYIVPEIIKKVEDRGWYKLHQMEIAGQKKKKMPVEQETEETEDMGPYQKILNIISVLDKGDGAHVQEIVENIKIPDCEAIVSSLIEEGEIFEIAPGKVKILE